MEHWAEMGSIFTDICSFLRKPRLHKAQDSIKIINFVFMLPSLVLVC